MRELFFFLLGYLSGSVLYAYRLPLCLRGVDITEGAADKNPGVFNCFARAGRTIGVLALVCELLKGFLPVLGAAQVLDTGRWPFALVMAAPVVGHAFPLFHRFRGGKAITVSFGVTLGLLPVWEPFALLAAFYLFFSLVVEVKPHRRRSIVTFLSFAFWSAVLLPRTPAALGCLLISGVVVSRHVRAPGAEDRLELTWFPLRRQP